MRLVQLTPPGSACSIHLSSGILDMPPGVLEGLQLVVLDIEAARSELVERGVEACPVVHMEGGEWVEGRGGGWVQRLSDRDGKTLEPIDVGLPPEIPRDVPHEVTVKAKGHDKTEMTVTEHGYTSHQIVDLSRAGLQQCLDKMAATLAGLPARAS